MKIKLVHAHFLISIGDYSNERIGFTAEPEDGDTVESMVAELRDKAIKAVGPKANELYDARSILERQCNALEKKLTTVRSEWDDTAEFLRTQGIKPDAPPMPQFNNLLAAVKVEEESVSETEIVDGF
ncbi:hypothetical protein PQG02_06910 [Nostoc sp. UHCC 0926]|uniref:hypothetical protein n=1 Tax=unclassified Nostoc TaxID=2593658 RepID=UPI002362DD70|nr:hypothetical protein [Nostoc sp. UHCC 0926]WDD34071.1 hypothetical protein PQG02_06910 [Nostoc sp. UHCC 0926]